MTAPSPTHAEPGTSLPGNFPRFSQKHLLGIADLTPFEILELLDRAEAMIPISRQERKSLPTLAGKPMLFVWGMRDWCFTPAFLEEFERRFPQAETLRIDDAGHYVFEDAPGEIIARVRAFLAAHPIVTNE